MCGCLQRAEEAVWSPGAVDTGGCESPILGAEIKPTSSGRAVSTHKCEPYLYPQTQWFSFQWSESKNWKATVNVQMNGNTIIKEKESWETYPKRHKNSSHNNWDYTFCPRCTWVVGTNDRIQKSIYFNTCRFLLIMTVLSYSGRDDQMAKKNFTLIAYVAQDEAWPLYFIESIYLS